MKTAWLLGICSLATTVAGAQVRGRAAARTYSAGEGTASRNTGFGVKGGFSRADLQSTSNELFYSPVDDYLPTFHVGAYWQHGLTRFASVQAEALYARAGFRTDPGSPSGVRHLTSNQLSYLAVPVLFVGNLTETFSFQVGPQAAVLLAARSGAQPLDLRRSGFRRVEVGGVLGAEARAGVARLGVRYVYSLPVLNPTGAAVTETGTPVQLLPAANDYHNLVLQAYVGIGLAR